MIKPTRRSVIWMIVGIPVPISIVVYNAGWWPFSFLYTSLVILAVMFDGVIAFPRHLLKVKCDTPILVYIGNTANCSLSIEKTNFSIETRFSIKLEFEGEVECADKSEVSIKPTKPLKSLIPFKPVKRGKLVLVCIHFQWTGPLCLVSLQKSVPINSEILILPNGRPNRATDIIYQSFEAPSGYKLQNYRGDGMEFESLKDYSRGQDNRFIDWKQSAKHRKLLCKEFKAERNQHVFLAFDTGKLMKEPIDGIPRIDHAINSGLLLSWHALRTGDLVGLYAFDSKERAYLPPVRTVNNLSTIQYSAAKLEYSISETNFTLGLGTLYQKLNRRSLIVFYTDFVDTTSAEFMFQNLARIIRRHLVIFVTFKDPQIKKKIISPPVDLYSISSTIVADELLIERQILSERLRRLGVHCLDVIADQLSVRLLNKYIEIKEKQML